MKFSIVPKRKAKVLIPKPRADKLGQKQTVTGLGIPFHLQLPNHEFFPLIGAHLLPVFYSSQKVVGQNPELQGMPTVSDMPTLTEFAQKVGKLKWADEQDGSTLHLYLGVTKLKLRGKVCDLAFKCNEGGTVDVWLTFVQKETDRDVMGDVGMQVKHEVDIEVEGPKANGQKSIPGTEAQTPEAAFVAGASENMAGVKVTREKAPKPGRKAPAPAAAPANPDKAAARRARRALAEKNRRAKLKAGK